MSLLLLTIASFAQSKPTVNKSETLQKKLDKLTKEAEKQQIQIMLAQKQQADNQERCGESGHTRAQAKNHKGSCVWPSEQPQPEVTPRARYSYDPKTGEHTYVSTTGKIYSWKDTGKVAGHKQDSSHTKDYSHDKYPPYW